jgi:hypothetical protein
VRTVAISFVLAVFVSLLAAVGALGADPTNSSTATLSNGAASAKAVTMTISLHTELQCGRLMGGALVVTLPRAVRVPSAIDAASVLVGTRAARSVTIAGHVVTIAMPLPHGVICDSIKPGVAKIVFTRAAGLGNPKSPGTYTVKLRHGSETFAAALKIH